MPSHHEHVRRALNSLSDALHPFVEREFRRVHAERWRDLLADALGPDRARDSARRDAYALLTLVWEHWRPVFRDSLSAHDRNLVSELRHYRNRWAHQEDFDFDDAYRVLDDARRLCASVDATDAAAELTRAQEQLLEEHVGATGVVPPPESEHNRFEIAVFVACGAALGLQVALSFGSRAWPLALLAAVSFSYILIRRLQRARREHARCATCGRPAEPVAAALLPEGETGA